MRGQTRLLGDHEHGLAHSLLRQGNCLREIVPDGFPETQQEPVAGGQFFKPGVGLRVDGISVRVTLRCKLPEGLLDLREGGLLAETECPPSLIDGLKFHDHDVEVDKAIARQRTRVPKLQDSPVQVSQPVDGRLKGFRTFLVYQECGIENRLVVAAFQ